jgi:hypothetical protein
MNPLKGTATFDLTPSNYRHRIAPKRLFSDPHVSTFNLTPLASTAIFGLSGNPAVGEWGVDGPRLDIGGTFAIFYFYTIASVYRKGFRQPLPMLPRMHVDSTHSRPVLWLGKARMDRQIFTS